MIEKANVRHKFRFFSAELLIIGSVIISIIIFIITFQILFNVLACLAFSVATYLAPRFILKGISHRNAEIIDTQLVHYINILNNYCHVQDDIIYAFERSINNVREPLKSYNIALVNEIKHGLPVFDALENFKNKVDNKKFKMFIKNIQIGVKYNGSYLTILTKSKEIIKKYIIERDRRKSQVMTNRFMIYAMIGIDIIILFSLQATNPSLKIDLKHSLQGQLVFTYNIVIILFSIYKSFTLEKFEY